MRKHILRILTLVFVVCFGIGIVSACNNTPEETKYTVTYVGGEGAEGSIPAGGEYAEGETFKLATNTFTKTNYDFNGWNDGTKTYDAGADYTMPAKDVTFTAQWKAKSPTPGPTPGGDDDDEPTDVTDKILEWGTTGDPLAVEVKDGETVRLEIGLTDSAPTEFWHGVLADIHVNNDFYRPRPDMFIYTWGDGEGNEGSKNTFDHPDHALFKDLVTIERSAWNGDAYKLAYKDGETAVSVVIVSVKDNVLYYSVATFAEDDADFETVISASSYTIKSKEDVDSFTVNIWYDDWTHDSLNLEYALMYETTELTFADVTFDINAGSDSTGAPTAPAGVKYPAGTPIGLPTVDTWEGHTFNGWKSGTDTTALAAGTIVVLEKDVTYKADWTEQAKYDITFDLGNYDGNETVAKLTAYAGVEVELPAAPTWQGYTFDGWTLKPDGQDLLQAGAKVTMPENGAEYLANWHDSNTQITYTIAFAKGDYAEATLPQNPTYTYAAGATLSAHSEWKDNRATLTNYTFLHWYYLDNDARVEATDSTVVSEHANVSHVLTLYPVFEYNREVDLSEQTASNWYTLAYRYEKKLEIGEVLTLSGDLTFTRADGAKRWDGINIALSTTDFTDHVTFAYDWRVNKEESKYSTAKAGALSSTHSNPEWTVGLDEMVASGTNHHLVAKVSYLDYNLVELVYTYTTQLNSKQETFTISYVLAETNGNPLSVGIAGELAKLSNGKFVRTNLDVTVDDSMSEQSVTIGTSTNSGYNDAERFETNFKAGQTITVTGTLKTESVANFGGLGIEMFPYGSLNVYENVRANFRLDNYCNGSIGDDISRLNFHIAKSYNHPQVNAPDSKPAWWGDDAEGHTFPDNWDKDWHGFVGAKMNADVTITFAWTEANTIVITIQLESKVGGNFADYVATQTYTVTPLVQNSSLASVYTVQVRPDAGYIENAKATVTYTALNA